MLGRPPISYFIMDAAPGARRMAGAYGRAKSTTDPGAAKPLAISLDMAVKAAWAADQAMLRRAVVAYTGEHLWPEYVARL